MASPIKNMTLSRADQTSADAKSPQPIIRLEKLALTLASTAGPVNILRGVDLEVEKGEMLGIVGPSGSGKSTLLAALAGLEQPTSGRVHVAGSELGQLNEDALALWRRRSIGIVFQAFNLIPTMTALENVCVPLELAGARDAEERARAALAQVGLGARLEHYPSQLSGGEQQRVALARAVAPEPALILADEPTGNLDGSTGHVIVDLLFGEVARLDATLVLITHDAELAERCDRVVRLEDGRVASVQPGRQAAARRRTGIA